VKKALLVYPLIVFIFNVGAQDNNMLQKQYKDGVAGQSDTFPIKIDNDNIIRNSFIEDNTHVIEIQVNNRSKEEISKQEQSKIDTQLLGLGVNFCLDGTNESTPRTIGLSLEYRYFDKNAEPFHGVLFSQQMCDKLAKAKSERVAEEVKVDMKIRALDKAGTGRVRVCDLSPLNGMIKIGYSNEVYKIATFYVSDEYMVNSVIMNLNRKMLQNLRQLLIDADEKSKSNAILDNLNLGGFQTDSGRLSLNSHKGVLKGNFRSKTAGGSVTVSLDATEIARCLSQLEPHL
jgi:hypothetical protein